MAVGFPIPKIQFRQEAESVAGGRQIARDVQFQHSPAAPGGVLTAQGNAFERTERAHRGFNNPLQECPPGRAFFGWGGYLQSNAFGRDQTRICVTGAVFANRPPNETGQALSQGGRSELR
jgi:hypothetical protein